MREKVLVGMSGGVDSTVTALLLQKEDYEVEGVYMKLHDDEEYYREHFAKAKKVCDYLGIPLHAHDLSKAFHEIVVENFIAEYRAGRTPNPCVLCNRKIKFGAMVDFADSLGINKVATGHYVRQKDGAIYQGIDPAKDQSYFLARVDEKVIERLLFPLGNWLKSDVVALASTIPPLEDIATQKESNEICFVPNEYTEVLAQYVPIDRSGDVLDAQGNIVGKHKGYMHYTIGKRRGFTVHGAHDPHYVLALKPEQNQVVVGKRGELMQREFAIEQINLFEPAETLECHVKVRYRTAAVPAQVSIEGDHGYVTLHEPVFGIAKGQFAAFYDNEKLLGGGVIL